MNEMEVVEKEGKGISRDGGGGRIKGKRMQKWNK